MNELINVFDMNLYSVCIVFIPTDYSFYFTTGPYGRPVTLNMLSCINMLNKFSCLSLCVMPHSLGMTFDK